MYKDLYMCIIAMQQKVTNFKHLHVPKKIHKMSDYLIKCVVDIYKFVTFNFVHKFNI
jgi:hypothetical protein